MPPQTPVLMVANAFDRVNLNTAATLSASAEVAGHEARYLADYRRQRTWWDPGTSLANHWVLVDLGLGNAAAADYVFWDRGHNLQGATFDLRAGNTLGGIASVVSRTVPAAGVVGGDPAAAACATEEGSGYAFFPASAAFRYWQFMVTTTVRPVLTGLMVGLKTQLLGFSNVYDPDAGARVQRSEVSDAGWKATGRTTSYRRLMLQLQSIGSAEYEGTLRYLRRTLFERDQPAVIALDYGTYPARAWMYQLDASSWDFPKNRATHAGPMPFREVGISV